MQIFAENSNNKFKRKYLTGRVDKDVPTRNEYDVQSQCWELSARGEKETPIEKYRRLQCEMNELMNEVGEYNESSTISKSDKQNYEAVSIVVNNANKVLCSLRIELSGDTETVAAPTDEMQKLLMQVEGFQKNKASSVSSDKKAMDAKDCLDQSKRIAELEKRLHNLETVIGRNPQKVARMVSAMDTVNGTLLESVQKISTNAALLQPAQLDSIESRISALTAKLGTVNEKTSKLNKSNDHRSDNDKVLELYNIVKATNQFAKLLPDMLKRMRTLEDLHKYGKNLSFSLFALNSNVSINFPNSKQFQQNHCQFGRNTSIIIFSFYR